MIIGLGNDIIDIRRIEKTIERFGERFLARVFTETERRKSDRRAYVPTRQRFLRIAQCALGHGQAQVPAPRGLVGQEILIGLARRAVRTEAE